MEATPPGVPPPAGEPGAAADGEEAAFLKLCGDVCKPNRAREILAEGGIQTTFEMLKRSPQDRRIQGAAVHVLFTLAEVGGKAAWQTIAQSIAVLLEALANHPADVALQQRTCDILCSLCSAGVVPPLLEAGSIEVVLQVMRDHRDSETLQASGCKALRGLMALPQGRLKVLKCGGVEAILGAMQSYPSNPVMQSCSCAALQSLCAAEYWAPTVVRLGAVEVVLDAMKRLQGNADFQEAALRMLWPLSAIESARTAMKGSNGVAIVMSAMDDHRSVLPIQRLGCSILCRLTEEPAFRPLIIDAKGETTLKAAVQQFDADSDVQYYGKKALKLISAVDEQPVMSTPSSPMVDGTPGLVFQKRRNMEFMCEADV